MIDRKIDFCRDLCYNYLVKTKRTREKTKKKTLKKKLSTKEITFKEVTYLGFYIRQPYGWLFFMPCGIKYIKGQNGLKNRPNLDKI